MKKRKYINWKPGIKRKVLIIGDCNLLGDYSPDGDLIGYKSWAWQLRNMFNEDYSFYTLPLPDCSLMQINAVLKYMNDSDLLDMFTHCIISLPSDSYQTFYTNDSESYFKALHSFLLTDRYLGHDIYDGRLLYDKFLAPNTIISTGNNDNMFNIVGKSVNVDKTVEIVLRDIGVQFSDSIKNSIFNKQLFSMNYQILLDVLRKNNVVPILFDFKPRSVAQYKQMHKIRSYDDLELYPNNPYIFTEPENTYWSLMEMIEIYGEFEDNIKVSAKGTLDIVGQLAFAKTLYFHLTDKLLLDWIVVNDKKVEE